MMTDVEKACQRYVRAFERGRLVLKHGNTIETQTKHFAAAFERDREIRSAASPILNRFVVQGMNRPFYYAFARRLDRLCRQFGPGESVNNEVRLLLDLWSGRGLDRRALTAIAVEVFHVGVDVPA